VKDVCRSLIRSGFQKIVIVNGHGGNPSLITEAMVEVKQETDAFIVIVDWWSLALDVIGKEMETSPEHACELETSMLLALGYPVDMKKAMGQELPPPIPGFTKFDFKDYGLLNSDFWGVFSVLKTGAVNHPEKATKKKGEVVMEAAVQRLAELLEKVREKKVEKHFSKPTSRLT
jgi:creatinine amidohydrolase